MRRLQGELWDDEPSFDFDSLRVEGERLRAEQEQLVAEREVSGETPDCSTGGPVQSSSMLTGAGTGGGTSGATGAAAAAAAVGPSNLGRLGAAQRDGSAR